MPADDLPVTAYADPGPDQRMQPLSYHVDMILMLVGKDGQISPSELKEIVRLQQGLQMIGDQRSANMAAQQQAAAPSNETEDYGTSPGTSPVYPE